MFRIITNGVEPTLEEIRDNVINILALYHEDFFLDAEVLFVGSNIDREVEISKFKQIDNTGVTKTFSTDGLTETLINRSYDNGDNYYKAKVTTDASWVIQRRHDDRLHLTIYINPKIFNLVKFAEYMFEDLLDD